MSLLISFLLTVHVIVCLLLVLVVLMQLPRSEGLGAAFGGSVTQDIFGAQTTNVLAKFTVWLGVAFFVLTLILAVAYARKDAGDTAVQRQLKAAAAATAPAVAGTPAAAPAASVAPAASPVAVETSATPAPEASASPAASAAPSASPVATP
ncbi:MAG: preprotein translocase subunit SecG [Verrucomicrobia bacterium 61-8]|mgnify:CR=1 FL=1|nr:preprotein translocase subunit SecG [Verrucomicrobiota bacterium]OJU98015.1 MAG: preprotein translocase subunit SecG [Verrucomicrobia bacterium 61-8]